MEQQNAQEVHTKLRNLSTEMGKRLVNRDDEVRGILAAAVAGQHVCLLGDPGTGKSYLARLFAAGMGLHPEQRGDYFELLLTKTTKDTEVLGSWRMQGIKEDVWDRKVEGKLPGAKLAFLDEVFKGSSVILNGLLTLMNERLLHQDSGAIHAPLRCLIGASNELPGDDDGLGAFWDRFTVRFWCQPVTNTPAGYRALRALKKAETSGALPALPQCAQIEDLDVARAAARDVEFPANVDDALFALVKEAREAGIPVSDRKIAQVDTLLRAYAWMEGSPTVATRHFRVLANALWETQDHLPIIAKLVEKHMQSPLDEVSRAYQGAVKLAKSCETPLTGMSQAEKTAYCDKLERTIRELDLVKKSGEAIEEKLSAADKEELARMMNGIDALKAQLKTAYGQAKFSNLGF